MVPSESKHPPERTLGEPGSPSLLATVALGDSVCWPGCRGFLGSRRATMPPRSTSCGQRRTTTAAQAQRMAARGSGPRRRLSAALRGARASSRGGAAGAQSPRAEARPRGTGRWCMSVRDEPGAGTTGTTTGRRRERRGGTRSCPCGLAGASLPSSAQCPRLPRRRQINPPLRPSKGEGSRRIRQRAPRQPGAGAGTGTGRGRAPPLTSASGS